VLFMQGGAIGENAIVPLNMMGERGVADYVNTGSWSTKSIKEARRYGAVRVIASGEAEGFSRIPAQSEWRPSQDAAYVHICGNETIHGLEYHWIPESSPDIPLVSDVSSHILSRPLDVTRFGLIYGGAQKNVGPAGLTLVIVRADLVGRAHPHCPTAFDYAEVAKNDSMVNTPPTWAIYIAGLVFKWLKKQAHDGKSALQVMGERNDAKAALLYAALDASEFYRTHVVPADRSAMNVTFFLPDARLDATFVAEARERGILQIKGHKSIGGMRASIYNAVPIEAAQALAAFLADFERRHG
jgi:phosphoserine aminotransferase